MGTLFPYLTFNMVFFYYTVSKEAASLFYFLKKNLYIVEQK